MATNFSTVRQSYTLGLPRIGLLGVVTFTALGLFAGCTAFVADTDPDSNGADGSDGGVADPTPPGGKDDSDTGEDPPPHTPVAMITTSLEESNADLTNPERGFYASVNLLNAPNMSDDRDNGNTLLLALVRLDGYRDRPLDAAFFSALQAGFDRGAAAGVKFILRFSYNASFGDDAPLSRVLGHIAQLEPYLVANADVISVVQAGFIGAWGEWHASTNGLDNTQARSSILNALLDAVPTNRFVQIRTPMFKDTLLPGGPISEEESFSSSARARVGHHNDCFLSSSSDVGTYASPVEDWKEYIAEDTLAVPMGGETCAVYAPRAGCGTALDEMEFMHWTYINSEYHLGVIDGWDQQGCLDEINQRLGYRLAVTEVSHAAEVTPGGWLPVELEIFNRGFAAPFNERPAYLVLSGNGVQHIERIDSTDPRRWYSGGSFVTTEMTVPSNFAPGTYSLHLWLPDASESLSADPRYAIRLANVGGWDDDTGYNLLANDVVVVAP